MADPQGLVRSRVLTAEDGYAGGVRIALNMPPLGGRAGPAAQHVAFSCDDIFAVSSALRSAGIDQRLSGLTGRLCRSGGLG